MVLSQDGETEGVVEQLTQESEGAKDALTQPTAEGDEAESPVFISEELVAQYDREKASIKCDGVIFEKASAQRPLCFFRPSESELDVKIGRGEDVDVTVPSKDGSCGISRFAFRLLWSETGTCPIIPSHFSCVAQIVVFVSTALRLAWSPHQFLFTMMIS